jgi:hypothetical protein
LLQHFKMIPITQEKLKIFKKYEGDEDRFARDGSRREKELFQLEDWTLITDFQQRLEMIEKGLTSSDFEIKTLADLKSVSDPTAFDYLTKNLKR